MILFQLLLPLSFVCSGGSSSKDEKSFVPKDGEVVFEGDMIVPKTFTLKTVEEKKSGDKEAKQGVMAGLTAPLFRRWKDGVVPYKISKRLHCNWFTCFFKGAIKNIGKAMKEWTKKTNGCITFRKKTDKDKDWVHFQSSGMGHCAAHVGRVGGEQFVYLGKFCRTPGIIMHEIGHALGFFHEQSRPDRDDYVKIHWENIKTKHLHNFKKYKTGISNMGTKYDYDSIMHYSTNEFKKFSRFWKKTITSKTRGKKIGQRKYVSATDAEEMSLYYECPGKKKTAR